MEILNQHFVNFNLEYNKTLGEVLQLIVEDYEENNENKRFLVHQVIKVNKNGYEYSMILNEIHK